MRNRIARALLVVLVAARCQAAVPGECDDGVPNVVAAVGRERIVAIQQRTSGAFLRVFATSPDVRQLGSVALPEPVLGLAPGSTDGATLAWSRHAGYVLDLARLTVTRFVQVDEGILQIAACNRPGATKSEAFVLVGHAGSTGRPEGTHLEVARLDATVAPRRLSPEPRYNFWALSVADVDGDGAEDVGLCTFSRTTRDARYAQRFFVYGWGPDGNLYPKWRGSRLCRPYLEATLVPAGLGALLVSRETGLAGGSLLATYAWNQFGFWGAGETDELPAAEKPRLADVDGDGHDELVAVCTDAAGARRATAFALREGHWTPVLRSDSLPSNQDIVVVPSTGGAVVIAFTSHGDPTPRPLPLRPVERGYQDAG